MTGPTTDTNQIELSPRDQPSSVTIIHRVVAATVDLLVLMVLIGWIEHYLQDMLGAAVNLSVTFAYYALMLFTIPATHLLFAATSL